MENNFSYINHTHLYFGNLQEALQELLPYHTIIMCYGTGSIKRNHYYDEIIKSIPNEIYSLIEINGIQSNPTKELVDNALNKISKELADNTLDKLIKPIILSVGGGSVHDFSKALSIALADTSKDWYKYWLNGEYRQHIDNVIPVGCISTTFGSGSEMNASTVISNSKTKTKLETVFDDNVRPIFACLMPDWCNDRTPANMNAQIFDIVIHIIEQYVSDSVICSSDWLALGLLKSTIDNIFEFYTDDYWECPDECDKPDYTDLIWNSIYACNSLLSKGKTPDWGLHLIAQNLGGVTNITHGKTLALLCREYYKFLQRLCESKYCMFENLQTRFKRFYDFFGMSIIDLLNKLITVMHLNDYMDYINITYEDIDKTIKETAKHKDEYTFLSYVGKIEIAKILWNSIQYK